MTKTYSFQKMRSNSFGIKIDENGSANPHRYLYVSKGDEPGQQEVDILDIIDAANRGEVNRWNDGKVSGDVSLIIWLQIIMILMIGAGLLHIYGLI